MNVDEIHRRWYNSSIDLLLMMIGHWYVLRLRLKMEMKRWRHIYSEIKEMKQISCCRWTGSAYQLVPIRLIADGGMRIDEDARWNAAGK